MDSLNSEIAAALTPIVRTPPPPRIWKFWGTALWGLFIFAVLSVGQLAVVAWFVLRQDGPIDIAAAIQVVGGGLTISLSVMMGLPAVLQPSGSPPVGRARPSRIISRCAGPPGPMF
jgi:hypothetical protein